jgi:hypothetical protein
MAKNIGVMNTAGCSNEKWGTYGWTFQEMAQARRKYGELRSETSQESSREGPKQGVNASGRATTAGTQSKAPLTDLL